MVLGEDTEDHERALEDVAAALRSIRRGSGLRRTIAIGEIVLRSLFSGDPEAWHNRRRNKAESLRRLARAKGCTLSKSALSQAVGVYVATLGLPTQGFRHVQASHVVAVLTLPADVRRRLLQQAEEGRWSVRRLRERAQLFKPTALTRSTPGGAEGDAISALLRELHQALRRVAECAEPAPADSALGDLQRRVCEISAKLERTGYSP